MNSRKGDKLNMKQMNANKIERLTSRYGFLLNIIESIEYNAYLNHRDTTSEEDSTIRYLENELYKTIKEIEKLREE